MTKFNHTKLTKALMRLLTAFSLGAAFIVGAFIMGMLIGHRVDEVVNILAILSVFIIGLCIGALFVSFAAMMFSMAWDIFSEVFLKKE